MKLNLTRWSVPVILVFCVTALSQARLPVSRSNYKTNSFATVVARESANAQANLQSIELLDSGKEVTGAVQAATVANDCVLGETQYKIEIVSGDKKLRVVLGGSSNVDLYIRRDKPVAIEDGKIVSDFKSAFLGATEGISLPEFNRDPLQSGSYFIAITNCATTATTYRLTATVTDPPDAAILDIGKDPFSSFSVTVGSIPAPVPGNCGISRTQYRLFASNSLCEGSFGNATIRADQNVNVLIRKDKPVTVENGVFMYDRMSENQVKVHQLTNFQQTLGIGMYFIAVLNCGFEPVNYTVSSLASIGDPAPFFISNVELKKKKLFVTGLWTSEVTVLIDGQPQEAIISGTQSDLEVLIVKNAKKKLPRNQTVIISLVRPSGCMSNGFAFTRH